MDHGAAVRALSNIIRSPVELKVEAKETQTSNALKNLID